MNSVFLTAEWRYLLMANYPVDPAILKPLVPCHTELDEYNGVHLVSLVGFLFQKTKVMGISFPGHRNFEEVNLRFYVRYRENNTWKRGVVFVKEIVPRFMISFIANALYGEKYVCLPMRHRLDHNPEKLEVAYEWKWKDNWNHLGAIAAAEGTETSSGSEEEFITEHYWGYTHVDKKCTGVYQVEHPKWKVHKVSKHSIAVDVAGIYGPQFAEALSAEPSSVFLAEGSGIKVMKGSRLYL